jgi:glycosyltransferase involved in cell wall biosynthesis
MIERKGHSVAISALPQILEAVPEFKLVFAGEGPLEEMLRDEAEALGVGDAVVFAGFRRDVPALLRASRLLLLPSDIECLPLVILEAMASGLPVVASDVGGISEAIEDSVTGFLIRPRDVDGLAGAVMQVLESPDGGAAMGEAGRRKVEREFALEATIAAVIDLYEELVGHEVSTD